MNLGQHIVDSVVEAGAIERMVQGKPGEGNVFSWSMNANEQVEAAFLKRMEPEILRFSQREDLSRELIEIIETLDSAGAPPHVVTSIVIRSLLRAFLGIDQPPK